jgi:hypothetical protein
VFGQSEYLFFIPRDDYVLRICGTHEVSIYIIIDQRREVCLRGRVYHVLALAVYTLHEWDGAHSTQRLEHCINKTVAVYIRALE